MVMPLDDILKAIASGGGAGAQIARGAMRPTQVSGMNRFLSPSVGGPLAHLAGTFGTSTRTTEPSKGPGGLFGTALKVLDFGRAGIASTFKESIDLAQDVLAGRVGDGEWSPGEWWEQATNHYGFGDLIQEERDWVGAALIATSPLNAGIGLMLGAGVLADNIWADRAVGFIGDVAIDPLMYMGGFGAITRGLGAGKIVQRLSKVHSPLTSTDDLLRMGFKNKALHEQVKVAAGEAMSAASQGRSLSAAARSLRKGGEAGKQVARQLGLEPGLRMRLPGTGPVGRFLRQDRWLDAAGKLAGREGWIARQQYKNIAPMYKGMYDEKTLVDAIKLFRPGGWRRNTDAVLEATKALDTELAKIAGQAARSSVEFVLPGFVKGGARLGLGAKAIAQISDFPIRGVRKLPEGARDKISALFEPSDLLRKMQQSDDPIRNLQAAQLGDAIRHARGREHLYTRGVADQSDVAVKRSVGAKVSDSDLQDFADFSDALVKGDDFDLFDRMFTSSGQINRDPNNVWYQNLPDSVKALSDEDFFYLALDVEGYVRQATAAMTDVYGRVPLEGGERVWEAGRAVEVAERTPWRGARRLTENAQPRFVHTDFFKGPKGEPATNLDFRRIENKFGGKKTPLPWDAADGFPKGRVEPSSLKSRAIGAVDEPVFVWNEKGAAPGSIIDFHDAQGRVIGRVLSDPVDPTKPWAVADPNRVGKSVRRQVDERSMAAFGEPAYESGFSVSSDAWSKGMGRDIRTHIMLERMAEDGFPVENIGALEEDILRVVADFTETEAARGLRARRGTRRAKAAIRRGDVAKRQEHRAGLNTERIGIQSEELRGVNAAIAEIDGQMAAWSAEMREIEYAVERMGLEMEDIHRAAAKADTKQYKALMVRQQKLTLEMSEAAARVEFYTEMAPKLNAMRESFEGVVRVDADAFAADVAAPLKAVRQSAEAAAEAQRVYVVERAAFEAREKAYRASVVEYKRLVDGGELGRLEDEAVKAAAEADRTTLRAVEAAEREAQVAADPAYEESASLLGRLERAQQHAQRDLDDLVGVEGGAGPGKGGKVRAVPESRVGVAEATAREAAAGADIDKVRAVKFLERRAAQARKVEADLERVRTAIADFRDRHEYRTVGMGTAAERGVPAGGPVTGATAAEVRRGERFADKLDEAVEKFREGGGVERSYDSLPPEARLSDPPRGAGVVSEDFTQTGASRRGRHGVRTKQQIRDWSTPDIEAFLKETPKKAAGRVVRKPGPRIPAATVSYENPAYWPKAELGSWKEAHENAVRLNEALKAAEAKTKALRDDPAEVARRIGQRPDKERRIAAGKEKIATAMELEGRGVPVPRRTWLREARRRVAELEQSLKQGTGEKPLLSTLEAEQARIAAEADLANKVVKVQEDLGEKYLGTKGRAIGSTGRLADPMVQGRGAVVADAAMYPTERGYRPPEVPGFPRGRPEVKLSTSGKRDLRGLLAKQRQATTAKVRLDAGEEAARAAQNVVDTDREMFLLRKRARAARQRLDEAKAVRSGAETNAKIAWERAETIGPRVSVKPWETMGPNSGHLVAVNRAANPDRGLLRVKVRTGGHEIVRVEKSGGEWQRAPGALPDKAALKKQGWRFYEDGPLPGERGFEGTLGPDDPAVKELRRADVERLETAASAQRAREAFDQAESTMGVPYREGVYGRGDPATHPVVPNRDRMADLQRSRSKDASQRLRDLEGESRRYTVEEGQELQGLYFAATEAEEAAEVAAIGWRTAQERVRRFGGLSAKARADWAVQEAATARRGLEGGRAAATQAEAGMVPPGDAPAPVVGYYNSLDEMRAAYELDSQMLTENMGFVKEMMELTNLNAAKIAGNAPSVRRVRSLLQFIKGEGLDEFGFRARRGAQWEVAGAPMLEGGERRIGADLAAGRLSTPLQRAEGGWERTLRAFSDANDVVEHEAFVAATKAAKLMAPENRSGVEAFNTAYERLMVGVGIDKATVEGVLSGADPRSGADVIMGGRVLESGKWTGLPEIQTRQYRGRALWGDYEFQDVVARVRHGEDLVRQRTKLLNQQQRLKGEIAKGKATRDKRLVSADTKLAKIVELEQAAIERDLEEMAAYMEGVGAASRAEFDLLVGVGRAEEAVAGAAAAKPRAVREALEEIVASLERKAKSVGGELHPDVRQTLLGGREGPVMFSLDKAEQAAAQKLLKDALSHAEWGPWRLMSGDAVLDREMWDVVDAFSRVNDHEEWGKLWQGWNKIQTYLKSAMIATPGFVQRNLFGAFFNAWLDGVNLNEIFRSAGTSMRVARHAQDKGVSFLQAARSMAKGGDDVYMQRYVELLEVGVRGGGQAVNAVDLQIGLRNARNMEALIGGRKGGRQYSVSFKPWSPRFAPFQSIRTVNSWVEDFVRLGIGMDTLRWGGTTDDALARIAKSQFDYDELTQHERKWMKSIFPFYTWTRKNVPYQLKQLGAHPEKYNKLLSAKRNLELGTEGDGVVPDYFLEPFGVRLPFAAKGGTVYSAPDFPFQDLARYDPFQREGWTRAAMHLTSGASPLLKAPLEVAFGKQIYNGIAFRGTYEKVPSAISGVPFVMEALEAAGAAVRSPHGEWKMRDHNVYLITNVMPTIGVLRRIFPNEPKYQRNLTRSLLSTLFGMSANFNTPQVQMNWLRSQRFDQLAERSDWASIISRTQ